MIEDIKENRDGDPPGLSGENPEIPEQDTEPSEIQEQEEKEDCETEPEGEQGVDDIELLSHEIENLRHQAADNLDKAVRAQAEMENLRKRTAREVENTRKYGLERFLKDILPVIDSLELGISASDKAEDIDGVREGMHLTHKMLMDVLGKFGIEVIDPTGNKFNPELHEAVSMHAVDDQESGTVIEVMQKGYSLNGRLVRPAMVVVAQ